MDRDYGARFTIDELVEATGVPARRIRYYIEKGLAPPAAGRGRSSYYTAAHVEELEKIRDLRQRNLSHEEIRQALTSQDTAFAEDRGEPWSRIRLHPDLELHVRAGAPEHVCVLALQIQNVVDRWFGTEDDE